MSALGTKRMGSAHARMSAVAGRADIAIHRHHVGCWPKATTVLQREIDQPGNQDRR